MTVLSWSIRVLIASSKLSIDSNSNGSLRRAVSLRSTKEKKEQYLALAAQHLRRGTPSHTKHSAFMNDNELFDQSFNIAWQVLLTTGELGNPEDTSRFLFNTIARMMRGGERRRLLLANRAIDAYRRQPDRLVS
jgi:hypothetical protein